MWEWFRDECYFGMCAVRHTEHRGFEEVIHVNTSEEAKFLVERLNKLDKLENRRIGFLRSLEKKVDENKKVTFPLRLIKDLLKEEG